MQASKYFVVNAGSDFLQVGFHFQIGALFYSPGRCIVFFCCLVSGGLALRPQSNLIMLVLRAGSRLSLPLRQVCAARAYSTAQAPTVNVTNVPAPHCGSIRILSLNRPAARNAISRQLLAELQQQIRSIHDEGDSGATRALILASEVDTSFCAGADLKERATFTQEE